MVLETVKRKWSDLDIYGKTAIICGGLITGTCMVVVPIGVRRNNKAYENYLNGLLNQSDRYLMKQLETLKDALNNK